MKKLKIQVVVSLVLLFISALTSTYNAARLSAWSECDHRYRVLLPGSELKRALSKPEHLDLEFKVASFKPSGRAYSGSNDVAIPIVGGAALALLGVCGLLDTLRKQNKAA
jgi:hypothetical protein